MTTTMILIGVCANTGDAEKAANIKAARILRIFDSFGLFPEFGVSRSMSRVRNPQPSIPGRSSCRYQPFSGGGVNSPFGCVQCGQPVFGKSVYRIAFLFHPLEPHALAVGQAGGDVGAGDAGLALRHFVLRAAQRLPPRRALRRSRQGGVEDLLDPLKGQHEFGEGLRLQIVAQQIIVVHVGPRWSVLHGGHTRTLAATPHPSLDASTRELRKRRITSGSLFNSMKQPDLHHVDSSTSKVPKQGKSADLFHVPDKMNFLQSHSRYPGCRSYDQYRSTCAGAVSDKFPQETIRRVLREPVHTLGCRNERDVIDDGAYQAQHNDDHILTTQRLIPPSGKTVKNLR